MTKLVLEIQLCFLHIVEYSGLVVSAIPMSYIFMRTLESFRQDVVTTSVDMSNLHWTNTFPAVSICFEKGDSQHVFTDFATEHLTAQGVVIKKR